MRLDGRLLHRIDGKSNHHQKRTSLQLFDIITSNNTITFFDSWTCLPLSLLPITLDLKSLAENRLQPVANNTFDTKDFQFAQFSPQVYVCLSPVTYSSANANTHRQSCNCSCCFGTSNILPVKQIKKFCELSVSCKLVIPKGSGLSS